MHFDERENKLERMLALAGTEPAHRPEFYRILMESEIFVLGAPEANDDADDDENMILSPGQSVQIQNWINHEGKHVIPFFSSVQELMRSIERETPYMRIAARALFEMTIGNMLVLNPMSDHGKEFVQEEIEILLQGRIPGAEGNHITVNEDTRVMVGQPVEYPAKLVNSLTAYFAGERSVHSAWLAMIIYAGAKDPKPHLLIGLATDAVSFERISPEAGSIAADVMPDQIVDILFIDQAKLDNLEGVAAYLINDTQPFYEARWGLDPHNGGGGHA